MPSFFDRHPNFYKFLISAYSLLILIFMLGQIYVTASSVTDENVFSGSTSKIVVTQVAPGGASDRAGMQVGDTIISINGKTFFNAQDADRILKQSEAGSLMDYEVIRNGKILKLKVQAATLGIKANTIIGIFILLFFVGFGLYIGMMRPTVKGARVLSWALIIISPMMIVFTGVGSVNGLVPLLLLIMAIFIGFPMNLYAELFVPAEDSKFKTAKKLVTLFLGIGILFAFLTFATFIFNVPWARFSIGNVNGMPLTLPVFIVICLIFNIVIPKYAREKNSSSFLKPVGYSWMTVGLSFGMFPFLGGVVNPIYYYGLLLATAPPVIWFYLVVTYRLYGINITIKRSLQYSVFNGMFWVFLVIFYFWLLNLISSINLGNIGMRFTPTALEISDRNAVGFTDRPFFILMGILSFFLLGIIKKRGQNFLKKIFFKDEYDYKNAISEISEIIATSVTFNDLCQSLNTELIKILKLKGASIYLKENDSYVLKSFVGLNENALQNIDGKAVRNDMKNRPHSVPIEKMTHPEQFSKAEVQFIIPLVIKQNEIGALFLGEKLSETAYKQADIEFVESLSRQIAVSLENTRLSDDARKNDLIKRDIELAKKIQMNLLPTKTPSIRGLQIAGTYIPANDVGGDYYDFLTPIINLNSQPNKITVVVGDVAGKGISASLYMSRVQGIIRSLYHTGNFSPRQLLSHANELIYSGIDRKSFITMVCAEFEMKQQRLTFSRAGHLPILHYSSKDQKCFQHSSVGLALGMRRSESFNEILGEEQVSFNDGDVFILYSDGISEAMNENKDEYGFERLEKLVSENAEKTADEILRIIKIDLNNFVGDADPSDDITLVVAKIDGD